MLQCAARRFVAQDAVQHLAKACATTLFSEYPWAQLPRRIVPDVLVVAARELGDPVPLVVLMKSRDRLFHDPPSGRRVGRKLRAAGTARPADYAAGRSENPSRS